MRDNKQTVQYSTESELLKVSKLVTKLNIKEYSTTVREH
jgi:hypothetical protein